MIRKPTRALVSMLWPFLTFSGLPAETKILKPPAINMAKRMMPAMTKTKGMILLTISAGFKPANLRKPRPVKERPS